MRQARQAAQVCTWLFQGKTLSLIPSWCSKIGQAGMGNSFDINHEKSHYQKSEIHLANKSML